MRFISQQIENNIYEANSKEAIAGLGGPNKLQTDIKSTIHEYAD